MLRDRKLSLLLVAILGPIISVAIATAQEATTLLEVPALGIKPEAKELNRVLAKVDKEVITWVDLHTRGGSLDDLIDRKLIFKALKAIDLEIREEHLEAAVEKFVQNRYGGDRLKFLDAIAAKGISFDRFKEIQEEQIALAALQSQYLPKNIKITDAEMQQVYTQIQAEYAAKETVRIRVIAVNKKPVKTGALVRQPRAVIEELHSELSRTPAGNLLEKFKTSVQEVTGRNDETGQVLGPDGEDLDIEELSDRVAEAVKNLKPGQLSSIFEDGIMYKIVLLTSRNIPKAPPFNEIKSKVEQRALEGKRKQYQDLFLRKVKNNTDITIYE